MKAFELMGSITIDGKGATDSLNQVETKGSKVAKTLSGVASTVGKAGVAVIGLGTAAAAGLSKMATSTAATGDRVDKLSQKIGLSREGFQEWDYVLSQNGMQIETLQGGMKTLVNSFDDFKDGGDIATEAFSRLGLSLDDLAGKSKEEIFEATISGLQGVENEAERAALANDLFGRSGSELAPLLNQSAASIDGLKQRAHDLGIVMGDEAVDASVKLTDTIDDFKRAGAGLMVGLGTSLMPVLQNVIDVILANLPMIQTMFEQIAPILAQAFAQLLPPLLDLAVTLLPQIFSIIEKILPFVSTLFEALMPIGIELLNMLLPPVMKLLELLLPLIASILEPLLPLLEPILALIQPLIDVLMLLLEPLIELLNWILPPLIEFIALFAGKYLAQLGTAFKAIALVVGEVIDGCKRGFEAWKKIFTSLMTFINEKFIAPFTKAFQKVGDFFSDVFKGIGKAFKAPINTLIDGMNGFIRGLNKLKIPDWVPLVGGKGLNLPTLSRLQVGIDYVPSDDYPAMLHRGERVLTAAEARAADGKSGGGQTVIVNINGNSVQAGRELLELIQAGYLQQSFGRSGAYGI